MIHRGKFKIIREMRKMERLYSGWCGRDEAGARSLEHAPDDVSLDEVMTSIAGDIDCGEIMNLEIIKRDWRQLAGMDNAAFARPISLRDGVLTCEVEHPLMLRELRGAPTGKILENISRALPDACDKIIFVPHGQ